MSMITRHTTRLLSTIMIIALLFTSGVTPIFAEEITNQRITARPEILAVDASAALDEEVSEETLLALLERIDDYAQFTFEERLMLYRYFSIGYDEEEAAAEEAKANTTFYAEFQSLPASTRSEIQILKMDNEGKSYADLSDEEKAVFYDYLKIAADKQNAADAVFAQLSAQGSTLFDSMLLVQTIADGLFTLEEAQAIAQTLSRSRCPRWGN